MSDTAENDAPSLPHDLLGIAQAHRRHGHPEPRQGAGQTIPTCRLCEEEAEAEVRAILASEWLAWVKAEALLDLAHEVREFDSRCISWRGIADRAARVISPEGSNDA